MTWTRTPPTEDGWYWIAGPDGTVEAMRRDHSLDTAGPETWWSTGSDMTCSTEDLVRGEVEFCHAVVPAYEVEILSIPCPHCMKDGREQKHPSTRYWIGVCGKRMAR